MGARTSGNVNFDVGGGFPNVSNGVNSGLVRLRTATMRLDWKNTDLVVGQDQLFFAAELADLVRVADRARAVLLRQLVGVDAADARRASRRPVGEVHLHAAGRNSRPTDRRASLSGHLHLVSHRRRRASCRGSPLMQDAIAYSHPLFGHTFTIGTAGYYSRENWGYGRDVNGYAAMADWNLPLDRWFTLSGSFYRGQAIGGLGGGIGRSVLYSGPLIDPTTSVLPLNTVGGWAQLKYRAHIHARVQRRVWPGQSVRLRCARLQLTPRVTAIQHSLATRECLPT